MPFEALYSLMKENVQNPQSGRNIINGETTVTTGQNIQLVTKDYFRSHSLPLIDADKVTDDVLGFCTLVLSYAKAANKPQEEDVSPKHWIPFMPRTEFTTLYAQVRSKIPGALFDVFNILACYKTDQEEQVT
jgi:hypothetical protein